MYINNNYSYLNNLFLINLNKKYNSEIKERLMLFIDLKLKEIDLTGLEFLEESLNIINIKTKEINDEFLLKNKEEIISFFNPTWFKKTKTEKINKLTVFSYLHYHKRKGNIKTVNLFIDVFFKSFSSFNYDFPNKLISFYNNNRSYYREEIGNKIVHKRICLNNLEKEYLKELFENSFLFYKEYKIKFKSFLVKKDIMKSSLENVNLLISFLKENNFKYELVYDSNFSDLIYDIKIEDNKFCLHEKFPFNSRYILELETSFKEAREEFDFLIS